MVLGGNMKWVVLIMLFLAACSAVPVKDDPWYSMASLRYEETLWDARDEQVRAIQRQRTGDLQKQVSAR